MKKMQVVVLHGGESFRSPAIYEDVLRSREITADRLRPSVDWKMSLQDALGPTYDILAPHMPLSDNARYRLWKLWFDRCLEVMDNELILVGHSLGAIFLARYLAEQKLKKNVYGLFLVAAPFVADTRADLPTDWMLPESLNGVDEQVPRITFYHSTDDPVVPYGHVEAYHRLLPSATVRTFKDRGHFNQSTFPELVEDIKKCHTA